MRAAAETGASPALSPVCRRHRKTSGQLLAVLQSRVVSNATRSLQREAEFLWRHLGPSGQKTFGRHPVEGVVDLDRWQPLGIVRKHLLRREPLGIEASLPLRIVVPRGTHPKGGPASLRHTCSVPNLPEHISDLRVIMHELSPSFTARERRVIDRHRTPRQVQSFLNRLPYNTESAPHGPTLRSFRGVTGHGTTNCIEAALAAATILEQHGYTPLLMSLESEDLLDHVLFVFQRGRHWGSVARSRDPGLHGRRPVFRRARDLALSYVDPYVDDVARIVGYAVVDLRLLGGYDWRLSPETSGRWSASSRTIPIAAFGHRIAGSIDFGGASGLSNRHIPTASLCTLPVSTAGRKSRRSSGQSRSKSRAGRSIGS